MKNIERVGNVQIKPVSGTTWQLRFRDAAGRDIRRRVKGTRSDALRAASNIHEQLLSDRGFLPGRPDQLPPIHQLLAESIRLNRSITDRYRLNLVASASRFEAWLEQQGIDPTVCSFSSLKAKTLIEYAHSIEDRGCSRNTILNEMKAIRSAWGHAREHYGFGKPFPRIRLKVRPAVIGDILTEDEVRAFLVFLRDRDLQAFTLSMLTYCLGLRLMEAVSVRRQDIDFEQSLLLVASTEAHKLKTTSSERTLPLPAAVREALRSWIEQLRVVNLEGPIFRTGAGSLWNEGSISQKLRRLHQEASRRLGQPHIAKVQPRRARAFFATRMSRHGVPDYLLQAFMGHAAGNMLHGHYRVVATRELQALSNLIDAWLQGKNEVDFGKMLAYYKK